MRFLVDQPVSPRVAEALRNAGHDALHVRELNMAAAPDIAIMERARQEARIVITQDQDFGTLLAASHSATPSVIRLRLRDARAESHTRVILDNLPLFEASLNSGALVVISETTIRVRRLPIL